MFQLWYILFQINCFVLDKLYFNPMSACTNYSARDVLSQDKVMMQCERYIITFPFILPPFYVEFNLVTNINWVFSIAVCVQR